MNQNKYVKPLRAFDPSQDLNVDESFTIAGSSRRKDALSELEGGSSAAQDTGKNACNFKTSAAITAGIVSIGAYFNKTILLAANKAGELLLLYPEPGALKALARFSVPGSITHTRGYADGVAYCTTKEGMVYAVDLGLRQAQDAAAVAPQIIWQKKMTKGILTAPTATGKILIVAPLDGLYAFEAYSRDAAAQAIGKALWVKGIQGGIVSTPNIESGLIVVGSEDCYLHAFEYGGNEIKARWSYKASGGIRVKPYVSQQKTIVVFGTLDGYVYAVDFSTGKYLWNFVVKAPCLSAVASLLLDNDEYFFFGADSGLFYCVNSKGKLVWQFKTNGKIRAEAFIHENRIYFGSADNHVYGLDALTGKQIFSVMADGTVVGKPVIADKVLYFGSTDSFVHGVNI